MSAIPISYSMHLRHLAAGLRSEVEVLDKTMAHREMWLDKAGDANDNHVIDAYTRTVDNHLDRVMAKACAVKEAVRVLRGDGL